VRTLTENPGYPLATVRTLAFSPSGTTLATGDNNGNVDVWDLASGSFTTLAVPPESTANDNTANDNGVAVVAFSPSGATLAIGASSGSVSLWNLAAPHATRTVFADSPRLGVQAVAFSPDGQTLAIGDRDTTTYLVSLTRKRVIATFTSGPSPPYSSFVSSVAFSPDGTMLAAANYNGRTCVWNAATGHPLHVFTAQHAYSVAFSPDGELLAIGTSGGAEVRNLASGKLAASFAGPADGTGAVTFSPDGQALAAGDQGGVSTRVWNLATRRLVATLNDPGGNPGISQVNAVAFSPDGGTLATGDASGTSYLWKTSLWKAR
jgi:WD40 repeat protein